MISICIPTFEQYGTGVKHLRELLDTIVPQKGEFEVIVSDNSADDNIKNLCQEYPSLNIRYFKNPIIGISHNTNHAIYQAKSSNIKLMYMDDRFTTSDALLQFDEALNTHKWVASHSLIIDGHGQRIGVKHAQWSEKIIQGFNTIGMPSVTAFHKPKFEFDPNLKTLLDCEYYFLLKKEYGLPGIIPKAIVAQRYHDNSTSRKQVNMKESEYKYLIKKHNL